MPRRTRLQPLWFVTLEDRLTPATLFVNSTLDTVVPDAFLTLREAINAVNAQSTAGLSATEKANIQGTFGSNDTIGFGANLNGTTIQLSGTSRLNIQRSVTIAGPGADALTINGGRDIGATTGTQIFFVDGRTNGSIGATIRGLTFEKAFARAGTGTTTVGIDNSVRGGAIFNDNAALTIENCFFEDNQASFGGAVQNSGNLTNIVNSAFYNNRGTTNGGAITNGGGTVIVNQCTVNFNHSEGITGALTNSVGQMIILRSTVHNNFATNPGQSGSAAGGIWTGAGADTVVQATIVNDNSSINPNFLRSDFNALDGSGNPVTVNLAASVNNFVSNPQSAGGLTHGVAGNILGNGTFGNADAKLSFLQMNGGSVPTQVPLTGSPVIGKGGSNNDPALTDARGFPRQAQDDGTPDVNATIDIGATERISKAFTIEVNENSGFIAFNRDTNFSNAIRISNENLGAQSINFSPTVFATPQTADLSLNQNAEFAINDSVTINGPAARFTFDAKGKGRIFNTAAAASTDVITFNNLTLTGGSAADGGAVNIGDETVNFNDCTLTGNTSSDDGGAINIQSYSGDSEGTLRLTRTTISGNSAANSGGGVYFRNGGSATVVDSAIINNTSAGTGGGFYFFGTVQAGGLTVRNTTISGNSSSSSGGGIVLPNFTGTALIQNSTIVNNTAGGGTGGGIAQTGGSGIVDLQSSIVSGNTNATAPDVSSTAPVDVIFSALGSTTGFTFGDNANNITAGQNLLLGPLGNNGGPTLTHLPAVNSTVKNKGSNPAGLTNDARGTGFPRSSAGGVDIGAVEAALPGPLNLVVTNTNDAGSGSLRQAILDTNANEGPDFITFATGLGAITLTTNELAITDTTGMTTITGPTNGQQVVQRSTAGGTPAFRVMSVNAGAAASLNNLTLRNGSTSGDGGGLLNQGGTVTLTDCVIRDNTSGFNGGGIVNHFDAKLTVSNSSIVNNSSFNGAGGISNYASVASLTNATISGNSSSGGGGAIFNFVNSTLILNAATITNNRAAADNKAGAGAGGVGSDGTTTINNSIITGNTVGIGANAFADDVQIGSIDPNSKFNLLGLGKSGGLTNGVNGNQLGVADAKLSPLTDAGGGFFVHFLNGGSPAINAGDPANTADDVFGVAPFVRKDIGAVEFTPKVAEFEYSVGRDRGAQASVTLFNQDATTRYSLTPFGSTFTGGVRTASGDVTGDGVADLIVASGFGLKGTVKVFDGVSKAQIPLPETVAGGGTPFGDTFTKGILVAAGDLNADGLSDLVITAEQGGGARVRIFQSTGNGFVQRSDFIALIDGLGNPDSKIFRGGSRAAVSDINGDGIGDLVWAAGAGGGPRIATFNGALLNNGGGSFAGLKLTGDFFALGDTTLRDGCFLAGGDLNGDGVGDIAFGGSTGAPPIVVVQSGANLLANIAFAKGSAAVLQSKALFSTTFGTNSKQGIRVAVKDLDFDNVADLVLGSAPGAGSRVAAFRGQNLSGGTTGPAVFDTTAFPGFAGGVFVG